MSGIARSHETVRIDVIDMCSLCRGLLFFLLIFISRNLGKIFRKGRQKATRGSDITRWEVEGMGGSLLDVPWAFAR